MIQGRSDKGKERLFGIKPAIHSFGGTYFADWLFDPELHV
jgi:hypothetical protein